MKELAVARNIGELKKVLENLDDELEWYGWDDGCIIITTETGDIGYIENKGK